MTVPPDREQWLRDVEAKLGADELAFLRRAVEKMGSEQFARVAQLSPDAAVAALRLEMRCGPPIPTLTTRSP